MKTRDEVLSQAAEECLKDFYNYAFPKVSWEDFLKENQEYTKKYNEWEKLENRPPIKEFCGPRPYEFYYLPSDILKDIVLYYVHAYKIDAQQELLDTIKILKDYCKKPIVDKYIEGENGFPGHRGYEHPNNLEKDSLISSKSFKLEPSTKSNVLLSKSTFSQVTQGQLSKIVAIISAAISS